jgi:hypothetical protein
MQIKPATARSVAADVLNRLPLSRHRGRGSTCRRIAPVASSRQMRLGSIAIPKQGFLTQNQLYDREHMVFNPRKYLPEHRPLGSVN